MMNNFHGTSIYLTKNAIRCHAEPYEILYFYSVA